jgi:hypothetical protein
LNYFLPFPVEAREVNGQKVSLIAQALKYFSHAIDLWE